MAGAPAVQVTGARELRRALSRMAADLDDLKTIHRQAGDAVLESARERVPRLTGALGRTLRLSVRKTGVSIMAGRARVPYAGPIHFGWPAHNIRPQTFLYDALDEESAAVAGDYERRVADLVIRVGAETP